MNIVSVTSPFEKDGENLWAVWKKQDRVSALPEQKQDDTAFPPHACTEQSEFLPVYPAPPLQRMQYNTIVNRIVQASKKTGSYSAWQQ